MFILMCTLLVLVVVMGSIVLSRVGELFELTAGPAPESTAATSDPIPSSTAAPPPSSTAPPATTQPQETTIPHKHEYSKGKTIYATCNELGFTVYNCSCGKTDIRDYQNPLGHNYGSDKVIPATCTEGGRTERTCTRCKVTEIINRTDATDHKYGETKTVNATCTENGWTEHTCTACNTTEKIDTISTKGHQFGEWTIPSDTPKQEQRTCSVCKLVQIRSTDTTKKWVIEKSVLDPEGAYTHYQIVVDPEGDANNLRYELYIGLPNKTLAFDYDQTGLTIFYTAAGASKNYLVPASATVLTIYSDGKVTTAKPVAERSVQ